MFNSRFFYFIRHEISELLPRPIAVKRWHFVGNCVRFIVQVRKFGGTHKKKWGPKHAQFRSIYTTSDFDREYLRNEWRKISKIGKLTFPEQFLLHSTERVRWTLVHWLQRSRCEFGPTKMNFSGRLYFYDTARNHELALWRANLAEWWRLMRVFKMGTAAILDIVWSKI